MHSAGDVGRNRTDRQRIKRKAGYRKMLPGERQAMLAARPDDGDGRGVRGGQDRGAAGKISGETDDVIRVLSTLVSILIAVLLEKTARANSGLAPSQTDKDERRQRQGPEAEPADRRQPPEDRRRGDGRRRGLRRRRRRGCRPGASHDIVFEIIERRAEVKECRSRGRFPETMPGPLQYGVDLQAFVINLPVAQMLSLRRAVALVQAISGLSEATCLGYVRRLHDALHSMPPSPSCRNARRCMSTKPASGSTAGSDRSMSSPTGRASSCIAGAAGRRSRRSASATPARWSTTAGRIPGL